MSYTTEINYLLEKLDLQNNPTLIQQITKVINTINSNNTKTTICFTVDENKNVEIISSNKNIDSKLSHGKDDRLYHGIIKNNNNYRVALILNSAVDDGYIINFYWAWCGTC